MSYPKHLVAAGLLLQSPDARVLMVQTFNGIGAGLILPGGLVETGESPASAAAREVTEELGLDVQVGPLLAVEHHGEVLGRPSSMQFVFAARESLDEAVQLTLQPDEIAAACWVGRDQAVQRHGQAGQQRMRAALEALDSGVPVYLET